ncbi:MAG TPA: hypothetical protein VGB76_03725 [Pyrinomonadaceae bacterium]
MGKRLRNLRFGTEMSASGACNSIAAMTRPPLFKRRRERTGDFFARCIVRYPEGVHWVAKVLVEYRQVHGAGAEGLCATTVREPERNHAGWQYVIEKWRRYPTFAATAERLAAKHLVLCNVSS